MKFPKIGDNVGTDPITASFPKLFARDFLYRSDCHGLQRPKRDDGRKQAIGETHRVAKYRAPPDGTHKVFTKELQLGGKSFGLTDVLIDVAKGNIYRIKFRLPNYRI